MKFRWFPRT
ncbi:hypothetical protein MTR67_048044 [Solanum verrucosum]|uniref:Uncharacterized protein n=1 Tax=Solanum verrucosum TaxID=315347 RepID=A0AAF0V043_SOLVR|nr:hypothetical protein MTR67_048044 [Solanum verrucosum]